MGTLESCQLCLDTNNIYPVDSAELCLLFFLGFFIFFSSLAVFLFAAILVGMVTGGDCHRVV